MCLNHSNNTKKKEKNILHMFWVCLSIFFFLLFSEVSDTTYINTIFISRNIALEKKELTTACLFRNNVPLTFDNKQSML